MATELVLSAVTLVGIAIVIPLIMLATTVFGPKSEGATKNEPYESGVKRMIGLAEQKFSVKFYLLAILFILFDLEIAFLFPWATVFQEFIAAGEIAWFVFGSVMVFLAILKRCLCIRGPSASANSAGSGSRKWLSSCCCS